MAAGSASFGAKSAGFAAALALAGAVLSADAVAADAPAAAPSIAAHPWISGGASISTVEMASLADKAFKPVSWSDLSNLKLAPGPYAVRFQVAGGDGVAVQIPVCAGRKKILQDGDEVKSTAPTGLTAQPVSLRLPARPERAYEIEIDLDVSGYEHRIACGFAPRFGAETTTKDGIGVLTFASPVSANGGGRAVVFVPPGHDSKKPGAMLVGLHPWNGGIWTYAAYAELLHEAATKDVVLLMPSGLGNSLYTASAEEEVLRAIDAMEKVVAVDPQRVSIWGASMGGAGATTVGFHHPDKFAGVTSFFGDSKYDLGTYVKAILPSEAAAHAVNALDVVDNARNLPTWLVHGEDDKVSPIAQSEMLAKAMTDRGFAVQFDRVPKAGHEGAVVAKYVAAVVDRAAAMRAVETPAHVSYRSVRSTDSGAYGVKLTKTGGDAFVDLEMKSDALHVLDAKGVKTIELAPGALGKKSFPVVKDKNAGSVDVRWQTPEAASP
ncbi:MAG TPA: prolyl oligopeptidase family serine peptidase [Polyangiaceae bacterium]